MRFHKKIQKECEKCFIKADMLHNSIVKIIDPMFTYNDFEYNYPNCLYKKIKCPYQKYYKNKYADLTVQYPFMYYFTDLKNSVQRGHYYVMCYVYCLTLRMQKIKSEIIKYELTLLNTNEYVCNVLNILINELLLEYTILNKDFIIYNNKLSKIENYGEYLYLWPILWPNNLHIMNDYYNKSFDFGEKEFDSVMNELESE